MPLWFRDAGEDQDYERFCNFKHRTFNSYDCVYFLKSLVKYLSPSRGLGNVFTRAYQKHQDMFEVLKGGIPVFTLPAEARVLRHIANGRRVQQKSKYVFALMVRHDEKWIFVKEIPTSALLIPLDLHTGNESSTGLLTRNQNDRKPRELHVRNVDPIRYIFLFRLRTREI